MIGLWWDYGEETRGYSKGNGNGTKNEKSAVFYCQNKKNQSGSAQRRHVIPWWCDGYILRYMNGDAQGNFERIFYIFDQY